MTEYRGYDSWKADDPADAELGRCGDADSLNYLDRRNLRAKLSGKCFECDADVAPVTRLCDGCASHEAAADIEAAS